MKQIHILLFALTAFIFFSCNTSNDTPEVEEVVEEVVEVEEETSLSDLVNAEAIELPSFENEELNDFAAEFDTYFDKSMELLKAGDMEGLAALEEEGKALQEKGDALKGEISEADEALLEEYLKGKAGEMLKASGLDKLGEKFEEAASE